MRVFKTWPCSEPEQPAILAGCQKYHQCLSEAAAGEQSKKLNRIDIDRPSYTSRAYPTLQILTQRLD